MRMTPSPELVSVSATIAGRPPLASAHFLISLRSVVMRDFVFVLIVVSFRRNRFSLFLYDFCFGKLRPVLSCSRQKFTSVPIVKHCRMLLRRLTDIGFFSRFKNDFQTTGSHHCFDGRAVW